MGDERRIPAGWYPDPAGLPQLRWWDNHQWTEHTSDAREPLVASETEDAARIAMESPAPEHVDEPQAVVVTRSTQSIASMVEQALAPAAATFAPEPELVGVAAAASSAPAAGAVPRAAVDLGARFDAELPVRESVRQQATARPAMPDFVTPTVVHADPTDETFGVALRRMFRSGR